MKALSVQPVWALLIGGGLKPLEIRSMQTSYRGPLLIVTTKTPICPFVGGGLAIATVEVTGCRAMRTQDVGRAYTGFHPGLYAWELAKARWITPFAVRGMPGLFDVDWEASMDSEVVERRA